MNPSPYSPLSYTRDIFRDEKKPKILETSSGAKFEVSLQLNGMLIHSDIYPRNRAEVFT